MRNRLLFISAFLFFSFNLFAQSSEIACSAYKQVYRFSGTWAEWPNHWTTYSSEGRAKPVVRVTNMGEGYNGNIYRLQMFVSGKVEADFYVHYDSQKTASVREDWDDEYVNCYIDNNGDYIYTEGFSLKTLVDSSRIWATNEDSKLYFFIFSEDYAVVVK